MSLPVRRGGGPRRRSRPARASAARLGLARALAIAGLILSVGGGYLVTSSRAFALGATGLELQGGRYTTIDQVLAVIDRLDGRRPNLVTLRTATLVGALRRLPAVDTARPDAVSVAIALPDRLIVTLRERSPILAWSTGGQTYLVDVTGLLFATAGTGPAPPRLPLVVDRRVADAGWTVGSSLDAVDLAAIRQLAALTPKTLGSAATTLSLEVTDGEGFTIDAPGLWHAVFGIYTPTVRPPTLIDRQVQCLASLIAGREATLATIYLSPGADTCGTYTVKKGRG